MINAKHPLNTINLPHFQLQHRGDAQLAGWKKVISGVESARRILK